ncbi:MAG: universal stress protein [Acidimicrobiales bacterium]|nr:universal stress protein [Acidimicrobiales bacterium]
MSFIVVGVDANPTSRIALRIAGREARSRGADLVVIHVFGRVQRSHPPGDDVHWPGDREAARDEAEEFLNTLVQEEIGHVDPADGFVVRTLAVESDHPARVLVEHSAGASYLVVGSRGLKGFKGELLGSVSQQVVAEAHCPVLVVPHNMNHDADRH